MRRVGEAHQRIAFQRLRVNLAGSRQRVIARQDDAQRLGRNHLVSYVRRRLHAQKTDVNLATLQTFGDVGGVKAHHFELDVWQFGPQNARDVGKPIDLLSREESDREHRFRRPGRLPGRANGFGSLTDRKPCVHQGTRDRLPSVSTPRAPRLNSAAPTSSSRSRSCRLSEGCAVCSRLSAASVTLPSSATAMK